MFIAIFEPGYNDDDGDDDDMIIISTYYILPLTNFHGRALHCL